jgi:nucleotide-binding universal stress UspA family protein
MFKTIVVGVDGREGGRDALALAGRLGRSSGADLVAVRDVPFDYASSRAAPPPAADLAEDDAYRGVEQDLAGLGLRARIRVLGDASPARALHRIAEGQHADLIVVGSTRHTRTGRVFVGDHAAGALHGSPCPVAVAPRGFAASTWDAPARIGVGFDGRPEARQALDFAVALAREPGAALEVVSVVGAPVADVDARLYDDEWLEAARAAAEEDLRAATSEIDLEIAGRVVPGLPVEELVALSDRVDLVVVGSRGWGPVRRILVGSTAVSLMREARCPVLVLPRGAATGEPGEGETSPSAAGAAAGP